MVPPTKTHSERLVQFKQLYEQRYIQAINESNSHTYNSSSIIYILSAQSLLKGIDTVVILCTCNGHFYVLIKQHDADLTYKSCDPKI